METVYFREVQIQFWNIYNVKFVILTSCRRLCLLDDVQIM
jgi:hypothetical protein